MAKNHTIKQIEAALRATSGQPVLAAAALGLAKQSVYERIQRSPYLQAVMAEIDEGMLAKAVDNVGTAIRAGDGNMSRWYLERKGRHLGYGNQVTATVDAAGLERLAEAIATGGLAAIRAVQAALSGSAE